MVKGKVVGGCEYGPSRCCGCGKLEPLQEVIYKKAFVEVGCESRVSEHFYCNSCLQERGLVW